MTASDSTASGSDQPTVLDLLQASPVAPVLDMPVPRTPMEALAASPLGPLLDTPFTDIAAGALPPLPPLPATPPLPTLPPLPGLDQLLQPISELAGAFGTGTVGGFDPTALLQQSSSIIDTALSVGLSGLKTLDQAWDGRAALAAQSQGQQAQLAGEQLSRRGNEIATVTQEAAGSVARGNAKLVAVAESFVATAVAAGPVALTPPGQTMLIAAAADHLQRALTVIAETRAELAGHQSAMAALGAEIPVPPAPAPAAGLTPGGGPSPIAVASSLLESVGKPLVGTLTGQFGDSVAAPTLAAGITGGAGDFAATTTAAPTTPAGGGVGGGGGSGGSATSGFLGSIGSGSAAAAGSAGRGPAAAQVPAGTPAAGPANPTAPALGAAASGTGSGFAPGGMGSGARSGYDDTVDRSTPSYLVDAARSNDVVGDLPMVAPAVIGGVDPGELGADEFDPR